MPFGFNALSRTWTNGKKATPGCASIDATNWNERGNYFVANRLERSPFLVPS